MEEDSGTSYVTEPTTEGSDHDPAAEDNNNSRPQIHSITMITNSTTI